MSSSTLSFFNSKLFKLVVFLWCTVIIGAIFWSLTDAKNISYIGGFTISFLILFLVNRLEHSRNYHDENEPLGIMRFEGVKK